MSPTSAVGDVLAGAVAALSRVRRVAKPMHPRGVVMTGRLVRHGSVGEPTGAAFVDEAGEDDVVVRLSRSVGLPTPWPDVDGLAIRSTGSTAYDLLMSTTGRGSVGRFVLAPTTAMPGGFYSTLLPLHAPCGSIHLAARPDGRWRFRLLWAPTWSGREDWTAFATLELDPSPGEDRPISFEPVDAPPPGLQPPAWERRLRGPSYAAARKARGDSTDSPAE